jgi:bifunctional DNase/RNase
MRKEFVVSIEQENHQTGTPFSLDPGESLMFVEMLIAGIAMDPVTKMPIIILKDLNGENALPIWIGIAEASAIATQLEKIDLARPMTHDLLKNILQALEVRLDRIEVIALKDNTFFATIYLHSGDDILTIDSRPSDAIALALRTESPIFVSEEVLEQAKSIDLQKMEEESSSQEEKDKWKEILENLTPEAFGKYKM